MIKVLADAVLAFDRGERDRDGRLIRVKTKIGFSELPDWVEDTEYFKMAVASGVLKPFNSSAESRDMERHEALKKEIAALEEKKASLQSEDDSIEEVAPVKRGRKPQA